MTEQPTDAAPDAADDTITIDDFAKVQLRVAEIKTAERIEGAKKLLRLTVDVGEGTDRQLVAGIAESYSPERPAGPQDRHRRQLAAGDHSRRPEPGDAAGRHRRRRRGRPADPEAAPTSRRGRR